MTEKMTGKILQHFLAQFLIASLLGVLLKPKDNFGGLIGNDQN
jgi:hypothetical protein